MHIPVFLAILLIVLWFQLNVSEGFTPRWASEVKKDYSGNDIGSMLSGKTLDECKKECIQDQTCKGIVTDFSGDGPGDCWMKSSWGDSTDNDSRFTYKLSHR